MSVIIPIDPFLERYNADNFDIRKILELLPNAQAWLAGGSLVRLINNEPLMKGDFDLYTWGNSLSPSEITLDEAGFTNRTVTGKSVSYTKENIKVQLIRPLCGWHTTEKIFYTYDFDCCMLATDGINLIYPWEESFSHLLDKKLFCGNRTVPVSGGRLIKYMRRGYIPTGIRCMIELGNILSLGDGFYEEEDFEKMCEDMVSQRVS